MYRGVDKFNFIEKNFEDISNYEDVVRTFVSKIKIVRSKSLAACQTDTNEDSFTLVV